MTGEDSLILFAASGIETRRRQVQRACARLRTMGFAVTQDPSLRFSHQRFAGTDEQRLETIHRVADAGPSVALACRGGYGMTRLLDKLDWRLVARSVKRGTRWVGYSDMTAFSLALLAHTGAVSWHGPMAAEDFGRELGVDEQGDEANAVTCETLVQALGGDLQALGFKVPKGHDGLTVKGTLWGGNLSMVCSLLGTPHMPRIRKGILFLEDVGEHPYRIERLLLQLLQSGVLQSQAAVMLGHFSAWKPSALDRGFGLGQVWSRLAQEARPPILTGLPVGHDPLNLALPQGQEVCLHVDRTTAFVEFEH